MDSNFKNFFRVTSGYFIGLGVPCFVSPSQFVSALFEHFQLRLLSFAVAFFCLLFFLFWSLKQKLQRMLYGMPNIIWPSIVSLPKIKADSR